MGKKTGGEGRPAYEPPQLMKLTAPGYAQGDCALRGSGDLTDCSDGYAALGSCGKSGIAVVP